MEGFRELYEKIRSVGRDEFIAMLSSASDEELERIREMLELIEIETNGKIEALDPLIERAELNADRKKLDELLERKNRLLTASGWITWKKAALAFELARRGKGGEAVAQRLEEFILRHT